MLHTEWLESIDTQAPTPEKIANILEATSRQFRDTISDAEKGNVLSWVGMQEMWRLIAGGSDNVWSTKGIPHETNQPKSHAANDAKFPLAA